MYRKASEWQMNAWAQSVDRGREPIKTATQGARRRGHLADPFTNKIRSLALTGLSPRFCEVAYKGRRDDATGLAFFSSIVGEKAKSKA
jgi:hypothetical protein